MTNTLSRPVFAVFNVLCSDAPLVELTYPKNCPGGVENPWQMSGYEDQKCKTAGKNIYTTATAENVKWFSLLTPPCCFPEKEKKKDKKHVIRRPPGRSCRLLREFHSNRIFYAKLSEYNKGHKISYRSTCISLPSSNRLSVIICSTRASVRICVQFTTKFGYNISLQSIETICCRSGWLIVPVSRHTR